MLTWAARARACPKSAPVVKSDHTAIFTRFIVVIAIGVIEKMVHDRSGAHCPNGQQHRRQVAPCQLGPMLDETLAVVAGETDETSGVDMNLTGGNMLPNPLK